MKLIKFKAAKGGVVHDGTSMIVMNKGKVTKAPAAALEMLKDKGFVSGKATAINDATEVADNPDVAAADARAEKAVKERDAALERVQELEEQSAQSSDAKPSFELAGLTFTDNGGGWFEITGPEGVEEKVQGEEQAKARFIEMVTEAATAPDEAGDSGSQDQAPT